MNSVPVLGLLIHYYFGNINTSPIPAQPIQLLTNIGKILLKDQINAEINSTLSTFQNSLKNIFEKDYELDIWNNALTSSTAFFFTLIFAIFIYLRKKSYKKLIELEGKIGKWN
jgi:predicted PurR-regulated permease PerM